MTQSNIITVVIEKMMTSASIADLNKIKRDYNESIIKTAFKQLADNQKKWITFVKEEDATIVQKAAQFKQRMLLQANKASLAELKKQYPLNLVKFAYTTLSQSQKDVITNLPESPPPDTVIIDFSDIITQTNVQIKVLGWSADQCKAYLLDLYGKRSRQLLDDDELIDLGNRLTELVDKKEGRIA